MMPDEVTAGASTPLSVESVLRFSKSFPAGLSEIRFGKYTIKPLPSSSSEFGDALLWFEDQLVFHAHPEMESEMVARFLGLVLNAKVERLASRINTVNLLADQESQRQKYPQLFGDN